MRIIEVWSHNMCYLHVCVNFCPVSPQRIRVLFLTPTKDSHLQCWLNRGVKRVRCSRQMNGAQKNDSDSMLKRCKFQSDEWFLHKQHMWGNQLVSCNLVKSERPMICYLAILCYKDELYKKGHHFYGKVWAWIANAEVQFQYLGKFLSVVTCPCGTISIKQLNCLANSLTLKLYHPQI